MRSNGLNLAYRAQDAASEAIAKCQASLDPFSESKALALVKLIESLDRIQERIRTHRGKRRKNKGRAPYKPASIAVVSIQPAIASSSSVLGTPSTSQGQVSSMSTGVSKGDLPSTCQEQSSLPDKASQPSSVQVPPSAPEPDPDKTVPPNTQPGSRTDLPPTQPNS